MKYLKDTEGNMFNVQKEENGMVTIRNKSGSKVIPVSEIKQGYYREVLTKSVITKELKGMWNNTKVIVGFNIARVCWKSEGWMVIENDESFDDSAERGFTPIDMFRTQEELAEKLFKIQ